MSAEPVGPASSRSFQEWWLWLDSEWRKGDLHALACVDEALAACPRSPEFHSIRGKILTTLGRVDEAQDSLKRAIELSPNDGQTRFRLALLYASQGRHEEARAWIPAGSDDGELLGPLASLYFSMGDYAAAVRAAAGAVLKERRQPLLDLHEQALAALTEDVEAGIAPRFKTAYGLALEHLREGDAAAAEKVLRKLVRYCPTFAPGWIALRGALEVQGRSEDAQALRRDWALAAPRAGAQIDLGMSRKPGGRGFAFDPRDSFPLAPMDEVLTQVPGAEELKAGKDCVWVIDPGGRRVTHDPVISLDGRGEDKVLISYETGPRFVASVENAALVGRGVVVDADGRIARGLLPRCQAAKFNARLKGQELSFAPHRFADGVCRVRVHDGPAFLMAGPTDEAFGDWMLNFGPRVALMQAAGLDCPIVVTGGTSPQRLEILAALGVRKDRLIFHDPLSVWLFPRLYVPSWPSHDKGGPSEGVLDVYRRAALKDQTGKRPLLYLTRRNVTSRQMVNEAEVCELFARRGFEIVDAGTQGFGRTRAQFANAACVAGPFGSAFLNIAFCAGKPTNLALFPGYTDFSLTELALWHGELGQKFAYVVGEALPDDRIGRHKRHAPWTAPLDRIEQALDRVLEIASREPA